MAPVYETLLVARMDELLGRSVLEDANDLDATDHTIDPSPDIVCAREFVSGEHFFAGK